jgi:hypothetical protein
LLFNDRRFADGKVLSTRNRPHEAGTRFQPWVHCYDSFLRVLHASFIVTTADKLGNNYVVCCKKLYLTTVEADLTSGVFYSRVPEDVDVRSILESEVSRLAPAAYDVGPNSRDPDLKVLDTIPYAAGLVKLHKNPQTFRFFACSKHNGLRAPALWVTALLRSLHGDLCGVWRNVVAQTGVTWADAPPWYITQSSQLVDVVRRFNSERMPQTTFQEGRGWQGADVVRLYTNIPHTLLLQALDWVLTQAWGCHSGMDAVLVYKDKTITPEWLPSVAAKPVSHAFTWRTPRWGKHSTKGGCYLFTRAEVLDMIRLLVCNAYVEFCGQRYKQDKGIPMEINPAVFMANYFLFYYECSFMQRLVDLIVAHPPMLDDMSLVEDNFRDETISVRPPTWVDTSPVPQELLGDVARYVAHCFRHTARFMDNFTSGPNPLLRFLWYDHKGILGGAITGIYPHVRGTDEVLTLEPVPGDCCAYPTLDVRILSSIHVDGYMRSDTVLYDKRREPCYADIIKVQYIHVSSAVSARVGPNVLLGQLHRFSKIIMLRDNFVQETVLCVRQLRTRGFLLTTLLRVVRRFLQRHWFLYADSQSDALYKAIKTACLVTVQ